jgi:hypothetical protein
MEIEAQLDESVARAKAEGGSWDQIGRAFGHRPEGMPRNAGRQSADERTLT